MCLRRPVIVTTSCSSSHTLTLASLEWLAIQLPVTWQQFWSTWQHVLPLMHCFSYNMTVHCWGLTWASRSTYHQVSLHLCCHHHVAQTKGDLSKFVFCRLNFSTECWWKILLSVLKDIQRFWAEQQDICIQKTGWGGQTGCGRHVFGGWGRAGVASAERI